MTPIMLLLLVIYTHSNSKCTYKSSVKSKKGKKIIIITKHKQIKSGDLIKDLVVYDWLAGSNKAAKEEKKGRRVKQIQDLKNSLYRKGKWSLVFLLY